jgi:hypothetical protein
VATEIFPSAVKFKVFHIKATEKRKKIDKITNSNLLRFMPVKLYKKVIFSAKDYKASAKERKISKNPSAPARIVGMEIPASGSWSV